MWNINNVTVHDGHWVGEPHKEGSYRDFLDISTMQAGIDVRASGFDPLMNVKSIQVILPIEYRDEFPREGSFEVLDGEVICNGKRFKYITGGEYFA